MTDTQATTDTGSNSEVVPTAGSTIVDQIFANFDNTVDRREFKFNFRADKELGGKRPSIDLTLPVPSVEGVIGILKSGDQKQLDLLMEAVAAVIQNQARDLVNDDDKITGNENFPFDKVSWEFISTIPPKERRGGGIPKEIWEEFGQDYLTVMPAVTGKTAEQIGNAVKLLLQKFSSVKTAKPIITLLKDQLTIYTQHSANAEQFQDCVQFLAEKADTLLKVDDAQLLQNL